MSKRIEAAAQRAAKRAFSRTPINVQDANELRAYRAVFAEGYLAGYRSAKRKPAKVKP